MFTSNREPLIPMKYILKVTNGSPNESNCQMITLLSLLNVGDLFKCHIDTTDSSGQRIQILK